MQPFTGRLPILAFAFAISICMSGCAGVATVSTSPGPVAEVPCFAAGDPRVETAGFVRETLRLAVERDETTHTLMAFVVGDTLTLGAMVKGGFRGLVRFKVGSRRFSFPMNTEGSLRDVPVEVEDASQSSALKGQGASFRGTSWVNVELPVDEWMEDDTPLQLVFLPEIGTPLFLPDDGFHYRAQLTQK